MMQIRLKNIRANPIVGLYESERTQTQLVLINLWLDFNEGNAPKSDKIEDTIDYCEMTRDLVAAVNKTNFILLERLVEFVADFILQEPRISRAKINIAKPEVLQEFAECVSLTKIVER